MFELIVSVCLLEDHSRCKEVSLSIMAENATPKQCMMMSPAEISKWTEGHPKWFAKKWTCVPAGKFAKI